MPKVDQTSYSKRRRKRIPNGLVFKPEAARPKKWALRPVKNRIRDLQRSLQNVGNLPADVRAEHERELKSCFHDLARIEAEVRKRDLAKKYHMVRFFDRQKATRRLKQARKALKAAESPEDQDLARKKLHVAEVDLNYSLHFPVDRPYSALYPTCKANSGKISAPVDAHEAESKGDRAIWELVESSMESGTLRNLRDSLTMKTNGHRLQIPVQDDIDKQEGPSNGENQMEGNSEDEDNTESGNDFFEP